MLHISYTVHMFKHLLHDNLSLNRIFKYPSSPGFSVIVIWLGVLSDWVHVCLLGGDGSDMAFLAGDCESGRIMFGGRSISGDAPLDSISTLVSGPSCGKNSGGPTADSPGSAVAGVVSSFPISSG